MSDQTILATTLAVLMGLLIWGKWRYDGVTLVCLASLVLFGVVPAESAFSGFGHPAVITVALVLLISRGLQEAGMVSLAGNLISRLTLSENQWILQKIYINLKVLQKLKLCKKIAYIFKIMKRLQSILCNT